MKRVRKQYPTGVDTTTPTRAVYPNHVWTSDFDHDKTTDGRWLQWLTVLDKSTCKSLAIHGARSITAADVVQVSEYLFAQGGTPGYVKRDNGPDFIAQ